MNSYYGHGKDRQGIAGGDEDALRMAVRGACPGAPAMTSATRFGD